MSPSTELRENREFACELKFVVDGPVAGEIRDWGRRRLAPDPNASGESGDAYQITSLYFDTRRFDVYHRNGSFGRSKYRIRRYGESEVAFLERKLKTRGLVSKRRTSVELRELERLEDGQPDRSWAGHWYRQRLLARRLGPVCRITYRRTARVALTSYGPIRMTLDEDIRAWPAQGLAFSGPGNGIVLSENRIVIELKYRWAMPLLFKQLVEDFALNPHPVSKYRLAAVALGLVAEPISSFAAETHSEARLCLTF
jgi:hypothetical protein